MGINEIKKLAQYIVLDCREDDYGTRTYFVNGNEIPQAEYRELEQILSEIERKFGYYGN